MPSLLYYVGFEKKNWDFVLYFVTSLCLPSLYCSYTLDLNLLWALLSLSNGLQLQWCCKYYKNKRRISKLSLVKWWFWWCKCCWKGIGWEWWWWGFKFESINKWWCWGFKSINKWWCWGFKFESINKLVGEREFEKEKVVMQVEAWTW